MKSVPTIRAAPINVIMSPRQNVLDSLCFKRSQVPNATQSGAVLPSSVAFAAVVYESDEVHRARSQAVKTPAKIGKRTDRDRTSELFRMRGIRKGNNKKIEKNKR